MLFSHLQFLKIFNLFAFFSTYHTIVYSKLVYRFKKIIQNMLSEVKFHVSDLIVKKIQKDYW